MTEVDDVPRWPWSRDRDEESSTKATIATAAVKAQALSLVGDLRATLGELDRVLRDEDPTGQTGRDARRARSQEDSRSG